MKGPNRKQSLAPYHRKILQENMFLSFTSRCYAKIPRGRQFKGKGGLFVSVRRSSKETADVTAPLLGKLFNCRYERRTDSETPGKVQTSQREKEVDGTELADWT